jgi:hypothetical protein
MAARNECLVLMRRLLFSSFACARQRIRPQRGARRPARGTRSSAMYDLIFTGTTVVFFVVTALVIVAIEKI